MTGRDEDLNPYFVKTVPIHDLDVELNAFVEQGYKINKIFDLDYLNGTRFFCIIAEKSPARPVDASESEDKEFCICAAIKTDCGKVIRGHRHHDCIAIINVMGLETSMKRQGFVTSKNRFVDRVVGAQLQNEAGINSIHTGKPVDGILFSEDLY